ncbi:MAG: hypothetical protein BWK80_33750 [Desulfobacteraceae bacterium IS3]|nr:MAG: hypothetical protein BWK80_33750 [Desulfobacteraceae bacterium IS3]HAO23481.1 hypothetical protein [Desulfobacteraceae bacterium]
MSETEKTDFGIRGSGGQSSDDNQVVVFRLFKEEFGIQISNVREIVRMPDVTPIPRSPDYVAGICNLRGNVLPVIDMRIRFGMESQEATDHTRLLVVESGGTQNSLIVDNVREVMRMNLSDMEPPPTACLGDDRQFLSGVIKIDNGKRLILMLNLDELMAVSEDKSRTQTRSERVETIKTAEKTKAEEEQLVSFKIAGDEYAFNIEKVLEILKISNITAVPNVPEYVRGLFTIRNHLLPILDLRRMLGLPDLISEHFMVIDKAISDHSAWFDSLKHILEAGGHFKGDTDSRSGRFGVWLEGFKTSSVEVENVIKQLKRARMSLYSEGTEIVEIKGRSDKNALSLLDSDVKPRLNLVLDLLEELKKVLELHISEEQRALVVETDQMSVGYLVDWVDEVIRVPKSVIDKTPTLATSERRELKAVAKLDNGERLIMIMDESALVSRETSRLIAETRGEDIAESDLGKTEEKTLAQQIMDDEQLVTFTIDNEEYGIRIMQIQEINRLSEITAVPRAPYFIDGMTNLRGNVIPVLNIRRLFGLDDLDINDRSRIIIVDIGGNKTGLRVDSVNEVLRLSKRNIESTPSVVTSTGANRYMEGVCKLDGGKRIAVLLDVEKILDEKELENMAMMMGTKAAPAATKTKPEKKSLRKGKTEIAEKQ